MRPKCSPQGRIKRFWSYVNIMGQDKCWEWARGRYSRGYGEFFDGNKQVGAHIFAFSLTGKPIPDGYQICHTCDNPPCCNPAHLFAGTAKENADDMIKKNRNRPQKGSQRPNAILTESDIPKIIADQRSRSELAQVYGVSPGTIKAIRTGQKVEACSTLGNRRQPVGAVIDHSFVVLTIGRSASLGATEQVIRACP